MQYLTNKIKNFIKSHALEDKDNEVCGLILQNGIGECLSVKCKNISDTPSNHFIISAEELKSHEQIGKIIAFYHSHPVFSGFSEVDKMLSEQRKINCILYNVKEDSFDEYIPMGYEVPYQNRPFLLGIMDCLQLVRDFYQRELNIKISDAKHKARQVYNWIDNPILNDYNQNGYPFLKNHFIDNGFIEVNGLQKHDIILTKLISIKCAVHCAVFMENNRILHHLPGRLSVEEQYEPWLKRLTVHKMRHRSLI